MIKTTLGAINLSLNSLIEFGNYKFSAPINVNMHRLLKKSREEVNSFIEINNKQILSYGYLNKDGLNCVPPDSMGEYKDFVDALMQVEVIFEMDKIDMRTFAEQNPDFKPSVTSSLGWLID